MMTSLSRRGAAIAACSIAILVVVVAADLQQSSNTIESAAAAAAATQAGHRRRLALPLEFYAASKEAEKNNGFQSSADEPFVDYGEFAADEQFASVARRGFRNGGRDRFSHGFGRKRSVNGVAWPVAAKPDLIDGLTLDESEAGISHPRRSIRATSRRNVFGRGG